jgi:F420-0:gamma-glutamyl ligase-like protein
LDGHDTKEVITKTLSTESDLTWSSESLAELSKIPGFVRGKIKRNTEKYAREKGLKEITYRSNVCGKRSCWCLVINPFSTKKLWNLEKK